MIGAASAVRSTTDHTSIKGATALKSFIKRHRTKAEEGEEEGGFTLIELLIVVLILGILAAIVAFAVGAFTSTSAVAACNTDAKTVESAVAAYQATNTGTSTVTSGELTGAANGGPYIHNWPGNKSYYIISITGTTVDIQLTANDPSAKNYNNADPPFSAGQNYDTWNWSDATLATGGTAYSNPATLNVCAGA